MHLFCNLHEPTLLSGSGGSFRGDSFSHRYPHVRGGPLRGRSGRHRFLGRGQRRGQQYFSYIMVISFSGGRSWSTRREPPIMGKQLEANRRETALTHQR
jgi:hypothetical protein